MKLRIKTKRRVTNAIGVLFWLSIYFILRKIRFKWEENPLLVSIVIMGFIVHIFIYYSRISKLNKKKENIKINNVNHLKKSVKLNLDSSVLPSHLSGLIDEIEKWGVENELLRSDLYENSTREELIEFKNKIELKVSQIEDYIENGNESLEKKAVQLMLQAYNDLGLWTWVN